MEKQKSSAEFNKILEKLNEIPTLPAVAGQVTELINDPSSSSADIAQVLKKDQSLTVKVLKLVNSPYYGVPTEITDVQRALAFLGFNTVAQLVLSMSVFSMFPGEGSDEFKLKEFWKHALGVAVASQMIAKKVKGVKPEEAFTCGLLHDIGKVVLHQVDLDKLLAVVRNAKNKKISFTQSESELDIPSHAFLGEYIAEKWALPFVIRSAIRYHHTDVTHSTTILANIKPLINVVRLANSLIVSMGIGHSGNYSDGEFTGAMLECLNLSATDFEKIKMQINEEMEKAATFLQ